MAQIRIHRDHQLGLPRARGVARAWADQLERKFSMTTSVVEGETTDVVEFSRSGASGRLIVAADHFDIEARLGLLLGAFRQTIESEIERNLDVLLAQDGNGPTSATR